MTVGERMGAMPRGGRRGAVIGRELGLDGRTSVWRLPNREICDDVLGYTPPAKASEPGFRSSQDRWADPRCPQIHLSLSLPLRRPAPQLFHSLTLSLTLPRQRSQRRRAFFHAHHSSQSQSGDAS